MESTAVSLDLLRPKAHLVLKVQSEPLDTTQNTEILQSIIKFNIGKLLEVFFKLKQSFIFCPVREIKVTKHLADTEVDEDSDAVFISEINYPDEEVQWLLNDKVLFTNEVNTITHEGKIHKLTLKNLAPQDGGTITFQVRKVKESVTLKVKGKNHHVLFVQAQKK